jgi:hypothetical protein
VRGKGAGGEEAEKAYTHTYTHVTHTQGGSREANTDIQIHEHTHTIHKHIGKTHRSKHNKDMNCKWRKQFRKRARVLRKKLRAQSNSQELDHNVPETQDFKSNTDFSHFSVRSMVRPDRTVGQHAQVVRKKQLDSIKNEKTQRLAAKLCVESTEIKQGERVRWRSIALSTTDRPVTTNVRARSILQISHTHIPASVDSNATHDQQLLPIAPELQGKRPCQ